MTAKSIDEAIDIAQQHTRKDRLFVIGGGSVYEQLLNLADELYLTQIEPNDPSQKALFADEFYGDTFFPKASGKSWDICHVSRRYKALDSLRPKIDPSPSAHYFRFFKYIKRSSNIKCSEQEIAQVKRMLTGSERILFPIAPRADLIASLQEKPSK